RTSRVRSRSRFNCCSFLLISLSASIELSDGPFSLVGWMVEQACNKSIPIKKDAFKTENRDSLIILNSYRVQGCFYLMNISHKIRRLCLFIMPIFYLLSNNMFQI